MYYFKSTIKEYRKNSKLTQQDLADLVNVRRETINHIENGRYNPTLKLAMDLSRVLGAPIESLFQYKDE